MATHSSLLTWKTPEEPGGLQSMGLQRVRHDWMHTHTECGAAVKNLYQRRKCKRWGFDPWVGKIPWTRKWQLIPIFVPAESHGQRSMTSHSPWDCRVGHSWAHTLKTNEIVSANLYSHNMWKLQFLPSHSMGMRTTVEKATELLPCSWGHSCLEWVFSLMLWAFV